MPKIIQKQKIGSKGAVVQYGSGPSAGSYFYRELIPGTKNYKTKKIEGATSLEDAVAKAFDVATDLAKEPSFDVLMGRTNEQPRQREYKTATIVDRRKRSIPIAHAVSKFLMEEQQKADAGLIEDVTVYNKKVALVNHMLPYLESIGTATTAQISLNTFSKYEIFRAGTTPINRNREITCIKEFVKGYLVQERLIDATMANNKRMFPKVVIKETDRMANPAIHPQDWKLIMRYGWNNWRWFRDPSGKITVEKLHQRQDGIYGRQIYLYMLFLLHQSGMSPEEAIRLEWKQVEQHSNGIAYINTIRSKTQQPREVEVVVGNLFQRIIKYQTWFAAKHGHTLAITPNTLVFGRPHARMEPWERSHYRLMFRGLTEPLKPFFKGHKYSKHPYTQYSCRSSFIENHLRQGTDLLKIARWAGHDVKELIRSYERLDIRERGNAEPTSTDIINLL